MCSCLGIARSGYYDWRDREPSDRTKQNESLSKEIATVFDDSRGNYGSPRVHAELVERGHKVNIKRIARLMAKMGLFGRRRPKFQKTTNSDHDRPTAPNVLARKFEAAEPDQAWVADITYVWTMQGWMYLAVIIDLFSRRVVGWSMAEHMRTELVLDALHAALGSRMPSEQGLVFHSDRGSQYAADAYRDALVSAGITCSMSRRGNCWDNAVAESFFSTLKTELVHKVIFTTREAAKTTIAEWIEVFYNGKRRHSSIGYLAPAEFERRFYNILKKSRAA